MPFRIAAPARRPARRRVALESMEARSLVSDSLLSLVIGVGTPAVLVAAGSDGSGTAKDDGAGRLQVRRRDDGPEASALALDSVRPTGQPSRAMRAAISSFAASPSRPASPAPVIRPLGSGGEEASSNHSPIAHTQAGPASPVSRQGGGDGGASRGSGPGATPASGPRAAHPVPAPTPPDGDMGGASAAAVGGASSHTPPSAPRPTNATPPAPATPDVGDNGIRPLTMAPVAGGAPAMKHQGSGTGVGFMATAGSGSGSGPTCHSIIEWSPSPSELPPADYPVNVHLQPSPGGGWDWDFTSPGPIIKDGYVAPTINGDVPYVLGTDTDHQDYNGDVCAYSHAFVHFSSPGVYAVKVDYEDPSATDYIEFVYAGAAPGYTAKINRPLLHSQHQKIPTPSASPGAFFVESPDADNGFISSAMNIMPDANRDSSVDDLITKIDTAWQNDGRVPIDVVLVAHGNTSLVSTGSGTTLVADKYLEDNDANVQKFTQALNGKIRSITIIACYVARELGTRNDHLMKSLANGLSTAQVKATVKAYDEEVSAVDPTPGKRDGFFTVDVHGSLQTYTAP